MPDDRRSGWCGNHIFINHRFHVSCCVLHAHTHYTHTHTMSLVSASLFLYTHAHGFACLCGILVPGAAHTVHRWEDRLKQVKGLFKWGEHKVKCLYCGENVVLEVVLRIDVSVSATWLKQGPHVCYDSLGINVNNVISSVKVFLFSVWLNMHCVYVCVRLCVSVCVCERRWAGICLSAWCMSCQTRHMVS